MMHLNVLLKQSNARYRTDALFPFTRGQYVGRGPTAKGGVDESQHSDDRRVLAGSRMLGPRTHRRSGTVSRVRVGAYEAGPKKILVKKHAMRTLFFRQEKSLQDLRAVDGGRRGGGRETGRVGL
jgi:hypothetical protein